MGVRFVVVYGCEFCCWVWVWDLLLGMYVGFVVGYGCEICFLIVREEHRLRVIENRALRWMYGPKKDEVQGKWRKLHNEELCDLHSSVGIIRMIRSRRLR